MGFSASQGNAQAVMCSYASINGVPACADDYLLNQVMLLLYCCYLFCAFRSCEGNGIDQMC